MSKFDFLRRMLELSEFSPLEFDMGGSQILISRGVGEKRKNIQSRHSIGKELQKGAMKSSCEIFISIAAVKKEL